MLYFTVVLLSYCPQVQQYILATQEHHHIEGDPDCDLFMDADLSVLGAPLHKYIQYAMAVREEYSGLTDEQFTEGR
jgi:predicted metal-dependent HD superfamily phosphohydrolase